MTENIVVSGIKLETDDLLRAIDRAERRLNAMEREIDDVVASTRRADRATTNWASSILKVAAAYGAFRTAERALHFIVQTNIEFQKLEAQMRAVTGSAERARSAFDMITQFAKETPFAVQGITAAFTTLQAVGIEPTADMLRDLGNFAAAMGGEIESFVSALAKAAMGETTQLRERFFQVIRSEGDKMIVQFRGMKYEMDRTFQGVVDGYRRIAQEHFPEAMAERMKTLDGQISNLQDSAALLAKAIGEQGVNAELSRLVQTLNDAIDASDKFAKNLADAIAGGLRVGTNALIAFVEHLDLIITGFQVLTGAAIGRGIAQLILHLRNASLAAGGFAAALTANPLPLILGLAGAIGGPLLINLMGAKDEAAKLADELERASRAHVMSKEEILARTIRLNADAGSSDLIAKQLRDAGRPKLAAKHEARAAALRAEIDRLNALYSKMVTPEEVAGNGTGGDGDTIANNIQNVIDRLKEQLEELKHGEAGLLAYQLRQMGASEAVVQQALALQQQIEALEKEKDAKQEAERAEQARQESIQRTIDALKEQNIELLNGEEALLRFKLQAEGANAEQIEMAVSIFRANKRIEEAQAVARKAAEDAARARQEELAELEAEFNQIKSAADRMAEAVTDAFFDFAQGAQSLADTFARVVDDILREVARLLVRQHITEPLANLLAGAISGLLSAGASSFGSNVGDFGGGGLTPGGGLAAAVVPTAAASASPVVNQTINLNLSAIDGQSAAHFIRSQRGEIVSVVAQAVAQSQQFANVLARRS